MRTLPILALAAVASFAQTPWENPVRKLLKEGKPVIGATITAASPEVAAQCAAMGFDFIWIEMEHSPITLETARNMILATRGLKALPFIRVPINELWTAKRALDMGAIGVVFPFTSTPGTGPPGRRQHQIPRRPPRFRPRSLATFRWPAPEGYADFIDKNALTIIIIEEASAVDKIEEIAATPGIDVLFIGANDLAYSLGLRGNQDHPKHREAMQRGNRRGQEAQPPRRPPRRQRRPNPEGIKMGFTFFQGPSDMVMLRTGAESLLKPFGKWDTTGKDRPSY